MAYSLADSIEVVLPFFPSELFPVPSVPHIREIGRHLPALTPAVFECHLDKDMLAAGFHQGIAAGIEARRLLYRWIDSQHLLRHPAWGRIRDLCGELIAAGLLQDWIRDLVLEFDIGGVTQDVLVPSVFLTFRDNPLEERNKETRWMAAKRVIEILLGGNLQPGTLQVLKGLFATCAERPRVASIGIMTSRGADRVRVNVSGVSSQDLDHDLCLMMGKACPSPLPGIWRTLKSLVDDLVLCMDVGAEVLPRFGIECFLDEQPPGESRWCSLLDLLVREGRCSPRKKEALLAWPRVVDPMVTTVPWPGHLIRESLLESVSAFSVFSLELSHVKITCGMGGIEGVKAYFGFSHGFAAVGRQRGVQA